jgi:hypothetical protein
MKWTIIAISAVLATGLGWPLYAAQSSSAPANEASPPGPVTSAAPATNAVTPTTGGPAAISFAQYRDYRIREFAQRRARLDRVLARPDLGAGEKARLERRKAYYDWLAAMPNDVRDRRFRARFDEIDANHDGALDPGERAAWRERERAYYRKLAETRDAATH